MKKIKVTVNSEGIALINCPVCGLVKQVSMLKFKGEKHLLKIRCECKKMLNVELDFRKYYRKSVELSGMFFNYTMAEKTESSSVDTKVQKCKIANISQGGTGLQVLEGAVPKVGNDIRVKFNLDDNKNSELDRRLVVRVSRKKYLGCEFTDMEYYLYDKTLGFYLMA